MPVYKWIAHYHTVFILLFSSAKLQLVCDKYRIVIHFTHDALLYEPDVNLIARPNRAEFLIAVSLVLLGGIFLLKKF